MTAVPQGYRPVADDRFREIVGFGYDEFEVGTVIEHRPGRTVTEMDNVLMTALSGNTAPIHLDAHYSGMTEWGRPLVCSLVTLAIVGGMTVRSTSGLTVANLGWDKIELPAPVFVGDTLYGETKILDKRVSQSRPHNGIVTCETSGFNQDQVLILRYVRSFLVPVDAAAVRAATDY